VSLILEALKKLEREKKTPERGFLVTTRAAWPSPGARPLAYVLAGLALAGVGAFGTWVVLDGSHRPRQAAAPAAPPPTTLRASLAPASPAAPPPTLLPSPAGEPPTSPGRAPASRPSPEPRRPVATRSPVAEDVPPEPAGPAELRLEAVSRRDGQPIAVLSGHLVHEGDAFDNVRVIRIGDTEVEIEVDGQRRVLSF
jgi:hypothetical protein